MNPFASLGLSPEILNTLDKLGFIEPTAIQRHAIPKIMAGNDLLAIAQTGTGKTAAYALPSIERLKRYINNSASPAMHPVRMLILVPTRELAEQVGENIALFVQNLPLRYLVLLGGVNINSQIKQLKQGAEIIVATVGRLNDLVLQKAIQFNKIEIFILDEADKMLDIGFFEEIRKIYNILPLKKQTILFSATFSKPIELLAKEFLKNPQRIEIAPKNTTAATIEQHFIGINHLQKKSLLLALISDLAIHQVIIFCNTKINVEKVACFLNHNQISALAIHGDKTQTTRMETLNQFKQGNIQALVSTDVAARGLDINGLTFVINYDLPQHAEDYVHRIGRTGRAGTHGIALSLVEETNIKIYHTIINLIQQEIQLEFIDHFKPTWQYKYLKLKHSNQDKNSLATQFNARKNKKNEQLVCETIPGRKKRTRKKDVCALLLPNYGLNQPK